MKPFADRIRSLSPSKTVAIDSKAKQLIAAGQDVLNLSAGEPSEKTPDAICQAAAISFQKGLTKYTPPSGIPELRSAICSKFEKENRLSYKPEQIVVSSGAKHSIFNALMALVNPGDEVIIPAPYWVTYPELVKLMGGKPVIITADLDRGFKITPDSLLRAVTPKTKLVIINSPCNPTGVVYSAGELEALSQVIIENDLYCLSDEIYEHVLFDEASHTSPASLNESMYSRTVVVNGVSKTYAMTGWRIGYSACNPSLANTISDLQSQATLHPANPSQYAALAALTSDNSFIKGMLENLERKRQIVLQDLKNMQGVKYWKPQGAFYFFLDISSFLSSNSRQINTSEKLCSWLVDEHHVALVPGTAFGMEEYIRLSFTAPEEDLKRGMQRLSQALELLQK
jgi:aspartate aminotransferase